MSIYETQQQNGIGRTDDEQKQPVSRAELEIRLKIEELKRVQLRRRLDRLENAVGVEPTGYTDEMEEIQHGLLEELDELEVDDE